MHIEVDGEEEFKPLDESDVDEDLTESDSSEATEEEDETENSDEEDGATETESKSEEKKDKEADEVVKPTEKVYFFNGREMTADELYKESSLLNSEFTKRSQRLSELEKDTKPKEDVLKDYDQEEIQRFDKLAKAMGFVKKDEIEKENFEKTQSSILKEFISKHPEYNDPSNSNKLFETLKGYNTNLEYLPKNLEKAHIELNPVKIDDSKEKSKVNEEKVNRQSVGVNSGVKGKNSSGNFSQAQIDKMKEMGVWEE